MRVVFGAGTRATLAGEVERLAARRVLVLCTPTRRELAESVASGLGERVVGTFAGATMHVPVDVARAACVAANTRRADCCLAVGGGSTIGLAKAVALETGLPIVAIPTTYAGSEMTPIYGLTDAGGKTTGRDERVLPRTTIYDPELTLDLPATISAASGFNAIAHAVEALYAPDRNPIVEIMAEQSIAALAAALPAILREPRDLDVRAQALYGAWLAGSVLGMASMGLHHKLCHTLGGAFGLAHAQTHAVVLPYAMAYNAAQTTSAMAAAARAVGASSAGDAAGALFDLGAALGLPRSLAELGLRNDDLDLAAELAAASPYPNPRPVERDALRLLLQSAFDGRRPS
jgi:alcohol dehydrogenase class IV